MHTTKHNKRWRMVLACVAAALSLVLTACGGGGGGAGGAGGASTGGGSTSLPYLKVTSFTPPATAVAGSTVSVGVTVTNVGGTSTPGAGVTLYMATVSDPTQSVGGIGAGVYIGDIAPGQSASITVTGTIPYSLMNGAWIIGASVPNPTATSIVYETATSNITVTGGSTCTSDGFESDDTLAKAKAATFGVAQQHNMCEATADWISFSATQGQTYTIGAYDLGYNASIMLDLYGTDGATRLTQSSLTDVFSSSRPSIVWTAPASGTYYVRAWPWFGVSRTGSNTEYTLTVADQRADLQMMGFGVAATSVVPGSLLSVTDTAKNKGFVASTATDVSVYLSTDATVTTADRLLCSRTLPALAVGAESYGSAWGCGIPADVAPGSYYLGAIVNATGGSPEFNIDNNGSTAVALTVTPLGACAPDAYEEDDLAANAKPLPIGTVQQRNHCDDATDYMSLSLTAGQSYTVTLASANSLDGTLTAPDASVSSFYGYKTKTFTATQTGTYLLNVVSTNGQGAGRDYAVSYDVSRPDLVTSYPYITNSPTNLIAGGVMPTSFSLTNTGYAPTNGPFTLGLYLSTNPTPTTADLLVGEVRISALMDPYAGVWVSPNILLPKTLAPGTYTLASIVDTANEQVEVNESNNVTLSPTTFTVVAPPCAVDAYEDNDSRAQASSLALATTLNLNMCDDNVDWFKVTATANAPLVATVDLSQFWGPSAPTIFNADGSSPATIFYSGAASPSQVSWQAVAGQTYWLSTQGALPNGSTSTGYTLRAAHCTPDAYETGDTMASSTAVTVGAAAQARNFCENPVDWANFTASAGVTYTITGASVGANGLARLNLYDAAGTLIVTSSKSGGNYLIRNWTAPTSGKYYIKIDQPNSYIGEGTAYTLSVN